MSGINEVETVFSLGVVGVLVVVIGSGSTSGTVVALVVGEAFAEGIVHESLQAVAKLAPECSLKRVVVHNSFRLGVAHLRYQGQNANQRQLAAGGLVGQRIERARCLVCLARINKVIALLTGISNHE